LENKKKIEQNRKRLNELNSNYKSKVKISIIILIKIITVVYLNH